MKKRAVVAVLLIVLAGVALLVAGRSRSEPAGPTVEAQMAPLVAESVYEGELRSRNEEMIMSRFQGGGTIIELAAEGTDVKKGDVLIRLDSARVEAEVVNLEKEYMLARTQVESLENAELPLELKELELKVFEAEVTFEKDKRYLDDLKALFADSLVSQHEVDEQQMAVKTSEARLDHAATRLEMTEDFLHPSRVEKAEATLASAEKSFAIARDQLLNCTIVAPVDGRLAYTALHVSGEFRTVRVGDTVYQNLPLMMIPDMSNMVVDCYVPESELQRVDPGSEVTISFPAYPDLNVKGKVESVATMAQRVWQLSRWQKYFHVVVDLVDTDLRLRTGMSARSRVISYSNPNALVLPRTAVFWESDKAYCNEVSWRGRTERVALKLGQASQTHYEILGGLEAGAKVALPSSDSEGK